MPAWLGVSMRETQRMAITMRHAKKAVASRYPSSFTTLSLRIEARKAIAELSLVKARRASWRRTSFSTDSVSLLLRAHSHMTSGSLRTPMVDRPTDIVGQLLSLMDLRATLRARIPTGVAPEFKESLGYHLALVLDSTPPYMPSLLRSAGSSSDHPAPCWHGMRCAQRRAPGCC